MKFRLKPRWLTALACAALLVVAGCKTQDSQSASTAQEAEPSAPSQQATSPDALEPGKVSGTTARKLVEQGATLLDVRTPGEYNSNHIDGAVNIPIQSFAERQDELEKLDEPVIVYCRSGARSARAFNTLRDIGLQRVFDLGGIGRW